MCKLAAFPPGFPRDRALEIFENISNGQDDGIGWGWVIPSSGKLKVQIRKFPTMFSEVKKKGYPILGHMPHDGWTIAHARTATSGEPVYRNTHPFYVGNILGVHNGVMSGWGIMKELLNDRYKWFSETDSEVGLAILDKIGPAHAFGYPTMSGVFVYIDVRDGSLHIFKNTGSLEYAKYDGKLFFATNIFGTQYDDEFANDGVIKLSSNGDLMHWVERRSYHSSEFDTIDILKVDSRLSAVAERRKGWGSGTNSSHHGRGHGCDSYARQHYLGYNVDPEYDGVDFYDESGIEIKDGSVVKILEQKYCLKG